MSQQLANLSRREADVVLRATRRPPDTLVGRRLATHVFPIYASPKLVDEYPADAPLDAYPWVLWDNHITQHWMERHVPNARVAMRCNTALLIHEAVRTGIGVAHLAAFGADHAPGSLQV